jgi:hypothetical protein
MNVTRSIVDGVVGRCKTESSQKPVPLHPFLGSALSRWRKHTPYRSPEDWVFASRLHAGRKPCWGQVILRHYVRPTAKRVNIHKHIGWHTFRHTYSTLLRSVGAEFKVMQELLRTRPLCRGNSRRRHRESYPLPPQCPSRAKTRPAASIKARRVEIALGCFLIAVPRRIQIQSGQHSGICGVARGAEGIANSLRFSHVSVSDFRI